VSNNYLALYLAIYKCKIYSVKYQIDTVYKKVLHLKINIMKTKIYTLFLTMLSFLFCNNILIGSEKNDSEKGEQTASTETQTLQVVTSPDLIDLTTEWMVGYGNLHPEQKITLSSQTGGTPLKEGNLYLFSSNNPEMPDENSAWKIVVGHDLVVPIINTKNLFFNEINKRGFTAEEFAQLLKGESNWSAFIDGAAKTPVQCYVIDNQNAINKVAGFTNTVQEIVLTKKANSANELISLIRLNPNTIGFCTLTEILNEGKDGFAEHIGIIPIDKNRNGRIDSFENIYANPGTLTKGAWIGKYPRELTGSIYALSTVKPTNQTALDFMAYLTVEGQDNIKKSGYSVLSSAEKTANMFALANVADSSVPTDKAPISTLAWILIFSAFGIVVLFIIFYGFKQGKQELVESDDIEMTQAFSENSISAPRGLFYDKTHTWAFMEQDGLVKIGIDDFLKHVVGAITQLKLRVPGEKVRKGEKILTVIRDGKQLNIYSPVTGFIRKQNEFLSSTPAKINDSTFTENWVYQIEPSNWSRDVNFMFMIDKYRDWLNDEFARLKDFMANSANSNQLVYQHVVLQDGGELKDNILADLGPEVWEDFQTQFIDTSK
jgi:glycine cleavage system H lipoate-binding protein/ABC-type phosphate transport system substrate-binding protein